MSKFKKVLLMGTAYVLVAVIAIGSTIAYLTSSDSDVNVMTLGNVSIIQHEMQRAEGVAHNAGEAGKGNGVKEGALVPFVQEQKLYPATYTDNTAYTAEQTDLFYWGDYVYSGTAGNGLWNDNKLSNVMDKMVFVENNGKTDCYYRTYIAFECPEGMEYSEGSDKEFMMNINGSNTCYKWEEIGYYTVEGTRYLVMEATYLKVLKAGDTAHPSLLQVVMTHNATNEDMELLGDTYEIIVMSQAVQAAGFENANQAFDHSTVYSAEIALDTAFGEPKADANEDLVENVAEWVFKAVQPDEDAWDGTADTNWYNESDNEFVIMTAEQLAGFAKLVDQGNTFEGKTVKLGNNLNLYVLDDNNEPINFNPIGSYRNETVFMGTFDGQDNTIKNLSQNTWALDNGYYYTDCGLGLFGAVENAVIKNLKLDGADISGESAICGTVVAVSGGTTTFENITVSNANVADYQYYAGGIVGWVSGTQTFKNVNVDESTNIAAQWGDFDNSTGGMIGGASGSANIYMEKCNVACRIDAYNDVTSSYQWYAYRRCGMLIGNSGKTQKIDGTTYAAAPQLTCKEVTVTYGDWANYTYCEFAGTSWPFVRVQEGVSNSAYSNPRYGHPTDANGNTVVDDNHVHNDGEKHQMLCVFDQLYGGGQGVYGYPTHDGVTVNYNNK